jgi:predicted  nucleic acid-binding Zn-ribbon protein
VVVQDLEERLEAA